MSKISEKSFLEKGFTHIAVLIPVLIFLGLVVSANITTTNNLSNLTSTNVLGEDEEAKKVEDQSKEVAKKAEEEQKEVQKAQEESQKKQKEQKKEEIKFGNSGSSNPTKTKTETISPADVKSKTEVEGNKSETEIETADGQKIKTKIEVEYGQLKLKYVFESGRIKLKVENEQGQEVELADNELDEVENEIEDELEKDGIKISTGSGKPIFAKNNIAALTDFPLSVDVGTNRLIVTTPAGMKVVTVLPDQAVKNLLATGIVNNIEESDPNLTSEVGQLSGVVKLEIRNNEVVYRVKGTKIHNLLGFIPVDTSTTAFVSAETGQPVAQEQSLLANIIDLLSP